MRCCWRGPSPALPGTRLGERTRAGRVPASYPTTSTRRLMSPTADARTGRKAYADCRRDCRNTGINIQRGQQVVNTCALFPAPGGGVPRPRSLSLPKGRVGLYGRLRRPRLHSVIKLCKHNFAALVLHAILGAIAYAFACHSPPRTKPRYASLVPKGLLSLTHYLQTNVRTQFFRRVWQCHYQNGLDGVA